MIPSNYFIFRDKSVLPKGKKILLLLWENKMNHQISRYILSRIKLIPFQRPCRVKMWPTCQGKQISEDQIPLLMCLIKTLFSVHNVPLDKATRKLHAGKYMITNRNWPGMSIEPRLGPERKQINRMRLIMTPNTYSTYLPDGICSTFTIHFILRAG